ncbi:MAG: hypothetical protein F6K42_05165, partial [Leptolyngbya sp. SIO1D8]|nr:hypothetical protein [Leptolyngbya sp. SIO1D8]
MTSDLNADILIRLIGEVISGKNAAIIAQSYAKANASFLGYPGNPKRKKIRYNFDLSDPKSLPNLLTESTKELAIWQDESRETVLDFFKRLMFSAAIIKAVFFKGGDAKSSLLDSITSVFGDEIESEISQEDWLDFLQKINQDDSPFNRDSIIKPKAQQVDRDVDI